MTQAWQDASPIHLLTITQITDISSPVVNSACAAATHALGLAFQSIAHGEADIVLAGE